MHDITAIEVGVKRGMMMKAPTLPKWDDVKDGVKRAEDDGEPELWWKVADQSVKGKEDGS